MQEDHFKPIYNPTAVLINEDGIWSYLYRNISVSAGIFCQNLPN